MPFLSTLTICALVSMMVTNIEGAPKEQRFPPVTLEGLVEEWADLQIRDLLKKRNAEGMDYYRLKPEHAAKNIDLYKEKFQEKITHLKDGDLKIAALVTGGSAGKLPNWGPTNDMEKVQLLWDIRGIKDEKLKLATFNTAAASGFLLNHAKLDPDAGSSSH